MVAVKPQDADRIAAAPPETVPAFLVYGPDGGLVAERGGRIAAAASDPSDPFSLLRFDAATLAGDPARLADEAYAVSMFGGRRAILVRDGASRPSLVEQFAALLKSPPPETTLVVEAGDLKKTSPLRALFERDRAALAIACYEDDTAALGMLVDEEVRRAGLSIDPAARSLLVSSLGGDRMLSRAEIDKLCLYAHGSARITVEDVLETVVDSAGVAVDEIVDATATGDLPGLEAALGRAAREGLDASWIAGTVLRHFQLLDLARTRVDSGVRAKDVVDGLRPPVFYKRRAMVEKALLLWPAGRIVRAEALLAATARDARLNAALSRDILADALVRLCRYAAAGGRS